MSAKSDKYLGRLVDHNGSSRFGRVVNAWDEADGVVGLYIEPLGIGWETWREGVKSDSEHWTLRTYRPAPDAVNEGIAVLSRQLGERLLGL